MKYENIRDDQFSCGSCWAWAISTAVSDCFGIFSGINPKLVPSYILSWSVRPKILCIIIVIWMDVMLEFYKKDLLQWLIKTIVLVAGVMIGVK